MGTPKQLLPYKNSTIISHVIQQAINSDLSGIIVVINSKVQDLDKEVTNHNINKFVSNEDAHLGLGLSIKKGLEALPTNVDAVMFLLGDQPEMSSLEINKLINSYHCKENRVIFQSTYYKTKGHPVLFEWSMIPYLLQLEGDIGAKKIIERFIEKVEFVEMDKNPIPDIDTISDYKKLIEKEAD